MEIIVLILLYILSVIITRYAHIKSDFTEPIHLIICLIPVFNIFAVFIVLMIIISKQLDSKKISDWFFGIKEKD